MVVIVPPIHGMVIGKSHFCSFFAICARVGVANLPLHGVITPARGCELQLASHNIPFYKTAFHPFLVFDTASFHNKSSGNTFLVSFGIS